ncbi:MAG: tetratricopeptide repeat protein [Spirochaetales bacterium]|nr:tetratricopeptide repeat protein [Spirochaetales bacterium]
MLIHILQPQAVFSQENPETPEASGAETENAETGEEAPENVKLTPVFPLSEEGLVFLEGESAVSTNFATSAVFNYGASGYKSLQLIQQNAPYGGQAYFAEYAFYVEEEGEYAFWYGGTPPGPEDKAYPSFASTFRYVLDGAEPVMVYREDVAVVEAYTPSYYWMEVETLYLTKGVHRIRFEVPEKRLYDGRYYFFLDAFFFLRTDLTDAELTLIPPVFPENRSDRSIDNPFQSISYYETAIKENPGNKNAYVVLSMVYSLLGDYINAIKNLNKAVSLDPEDPYPLLLTAKNRIWNGEVTEGLTVYRQLLTLAPDNAAYWAEAGKVAAWTGNYRESIEFFTQGLEQFPDDLNLKVNLGLTYLWMARSDDAETMFKEAQDSALDSHDRVMELGSIHSVNGYPQYSENIYLKEIDSSPQYLETYLALESSYRQMGETEKAEAIVNRIYETFEESPELREYMQVYDEKINMKNGILQDYIDALAEQPDNIPLRQLLSQTYFWNGLKEEAVDHSLRILINKLYISMKEFDARAMDLLSLIDRMSRFRDQFSELEEAYLLGARELELARSNYDKAIAAQEKKPDDPGLIEKADAAALEYINASDSYNNWVFRSAGLEADKEALLEEWNQLLEKENNDEEIFRQLLGESEWSWDRYFTLNELRQVQRDEPFLAGYILSRLALFSGKYGEAGRYLETEVFDEDPPSRYGLYESYLWSMNREKQKSMWEEEADVLTIYRQHLFDMEAAAWTDPEGSGFMIPAADETDALVEEIKTRVPDMKKEGEEIAGVLQDMKSILDRQLVRQIYYYEQDTYLLRYSLGEYYLDMEENLKAVKQFERVLAMDPWNISANYKLGIVSQRAGNWSRAMAQYKKVYYQNPRYENAAYYYNQLARQNADSVSVSAQNITDTSRINYRGYANYQTRINTWMGWGLTYKIDMDRKYRSFDGDPAGQFKMHSMELDVPFTIPDWNLILTPVAGLYFGNSLFGETWDTSDTEVTEPAGFMDFSIVKPLAGFSAGWKWNFLDTSLGYRYQLERESMFPERDLTRSHFVNLNASTYFPLENSYDWGPFITRTYGQFEFLTNTSDASESNIKGQALQEASIGLVVARKPLVRLTANGLFNLEDGSESTIVDYYLPSGVLEAKGGLRGTVNFHNETYTENLELSLFGAVGGYFVNVWGNGDMAKSLKAESYFGMYYVKETMTLYLNIGGSSTFQNAQDLNFWEFSATLGARVSVPSLLTN